MLFVVLTFALMVASINQLTSVPIGVWDVKLEIKKDRRTAREPELQLESDIYKARSPALEN